MSYLFTHFECAIAGQEFRNRRLNVHKHQIQVNYFNYNSQVPLRIQNYFVPRRFVYSHIHLSIQQRDDAVERTLRRLRRNGFAGEEAVGGEDSNEGGDRAILRKGGEASAKAIRGEVSTQFFSLVCSVRERECGG